MTEIQANLAQRVERDPPAQTRATSPTGSAAVSGAERTAVTWLLSATLGFTLIINQVGEGLAKLLLSVADLSWLSVLWQVNLPIANPGGRWSLALVIGLIALSFYLLWRKHPAPQIRSAFYLGTITGGLILPFLAVSVLLCVGVVIAVWYALYWIGMAVFWVVSLLLFPVLKQIFLVIGIPFIWIWENALRPVLSFLGTPFVWLWDNAIGPLLTLLGVPLQWLWANLLAPVLDFVFFVLLKWVAIVLLILAAAIIGTLLSLGAFGAVWRVFEESFINAAYNDFSEQTAFACGVGTGLFLFEVLLAFLLYGFAGIVFFPAISHFLLLLMPLVFLLRLAFSRSHTFMPQPTTPYLLACKRYWATSRLEIFVAAAVVPVGLLISIFSDDNPLTASIDA